MSGSSEERNLPASAKKLTDERRKGRLAKAPDMQSAMISIVLIGWVLTGASSISAWLGRLFAVAGAATTLPFDEAVRDMSGAIKGALLHCALVPLLLAIGAALFAGLLINRGFIFSIDPLMPKLEKLNPINGLKSMFKPKNFVDLALSILKVLVFGGALAAIALHEVNDLIRVPEMAPTEWPKILSALVVPMMLGACAFYLATGIADLMIQKRFFMREMRMTQTELKNERKETQGNPQIKMQRMRIANENRRAPAKLGPKQATLMICQEGVTVGIRYKPGDTPVPRVVCIGQGGAAEKYRMIAREQGVPMCWNRELAGDLKKNFRPGMTITQAFFNSVAHAIQNTSV